jgi:RHS repeat-associated protein
VAKTYLFWDPLSDNVLQERDETGAVTAEYTAEPRLYGNVISQNRSGVQSQFHYDAQGSTLAVTDDNQNVTDTRAYSAFGETTESNGSTVFPFQYIGQKGYYRDSLTGQYLVRRRAYEPVAARWLEVDPLHVYHARDGFYIYTSNSPTARIDPSGLLAEGEVGWKRKLDWGPRLLDGKQASYDIGIIHILPPVPEGREQAWQAILCVRHWLTKSCKFVRDDILYAADIVTIGERKEIKDQLGLIPEEDDYCFYTEQCSHTVGFNRPDKKYEQIGGEVSERTYQTLMREMSDPKGTFSTTYIFVKKSCCDLRCPESVIVGFGPEGESLSIGGVGEWSSPPPR